VSGPGTYERGADICASLLGTQVVTQPEASAADKVRCIHEMLAPAPVCAPVNIQALCCNNAPRTPSSSSLVSAPARAALLDTGQESMPAISGRGSE